MKKSRLFLRGALAAALSLLMLTACSNDHYTKDGGEITTAEITSYFSEKKTETEAQSEDEILAASDIAEKIIDREGHEVVVPTELNVIVSGAPSITEILCGLGLGGRIAAADTYSSDVEGISDSVCTLDMQNLNAEQIIALEPDVVFIGGISEAGGTSVTESLKTAGINVVNIPTSESVSAVKQDIEFLAAYTKTSEKGTEMIKEIDAVVTEIQAKASKLTEKKKVYFEISAAPYLYSCGSDTFIDELITMCGAENIYSAEKGWISNTEESVIEANPDVIITSVAYDGYDYKEILSRAGWDTISAVKNGCVYQLDTNAVSRPSQNIVKGIKLVAEAVYPELYMDKE